MKYFIFPFFLLGLFVFLLPQLALANSENVSINAIVLGCGDSIIQSGEECDTLNFNGSTCITSGFASGSISCDANCTLNTSSCANVIFNTNTRGASGGAFASVAGNQTQPQIQLQSPSISGGLVSSQIYFKILEISQAILDYFSINFAQDNTSSIKDATQLGQPLSNFNDASNNIITPEDIINKFIDVARASLTPPNINHFPKKARGGEEITIAGQTYPYGKVAVFVLSQDVESFSIHETSADKNGNFSFTYKVPEVTSSNKTAAIFDIFGQSYKLNVWTLVVDSKGAHSLMSKKITIDVSKHLFSLDLDIASVSLIIFSIMFLVIMLLIYFLLKKPKIGGAF